MYLCHSLLEQQIELVYINKIKRFIDQIYSKFAHCELKTIPILEIKALFSCYAPLKTSLFYSLGTQY